LTRPFLPNISQFLMYNKPGLYHKVRPFPHYRFSIADCGVDGIKFPPQKPCE
jgi:hypothetical protein